MSQVGCNNTDKDRFDELQPENQTQKEFFSELLDAYEHQDEKVVIDTDAIIEAITHKTAAQTELAARRGVTQAIEEIEL